MALGRYGAYLNIISGIDSMEKENFIYKELDIDGYNTLDTLSSADKFNKWMYQSIKPFLKGNIIEIGSGIGNITSQLVNDKLKVTASDVSKNYCYLLKERFGKNYYINEVRKEILRLSKKQGTALFISIGTGNKLQNMIQRISN